MSYQGETGGSNASAEALLEKLQAANDGTTGDESDPAARTANVLAETAESINGGDQFHLEDGMVKQSLDELLVMLIALRSSDAHGKGVMGDISRFFGTKLSPGTVYPALHDLEESGVLQVHELVQTKEYSIGDEPAAREQLREGMRQHLAIGFLFQRVLDELDAE